ncbi:CHAT domain-containing protein [Streptomyces flavotricini]|uniref:CHAT domain-containing protein n=1 Tax=Streptomyces flavotricini TaxID=66888 RepID=A0ABS8EGI6_9ACTN|nr:CHAT domain-containing protein [Streptomyces flavotricini]MCC0100270.1 CHAT domain-containing protein [Streptomyces flavotricini]
MRAQLLESLRARIRAAERREDGGDVLSWEALSEAVGLLSHRRSQGLDLEALVTAGLLFFHRAMRQRPERRTVEMVAAAQLLGPVYASAPHLVPARVRAFYANGQDPWEHFSADTGFTTDPSVWWELHKDPTQRYLVSDEDRAGRAYLSLALALLRLARLSAGPSHPILPQLLTGTAALLGLYRAATGDLAACREAVEVGRAALRELPPGDPAHGLTLANTGLAALELARRLEDRPAAELAVRCFRTALALGEDEDGGRGVNLGGALAVLAGLVDGEEPLFEAVALFHAAADRAGETAVNNLDAALGMLLRRPESLSYERLAALCATLLDHPGPDRPADVLLMRVLGIIRMQQAEEHSDLAALREAVALCRRVLAVSDDPEARGEAANNASSALRVLAQHTQDVPAAREAIALARTALDCATLAERLDEAMARANLATAHNVLFELTGDLEAQREAVYASRRAVEALAPEEHAEHAGLVTAQAMILHRYASRTRDLALLREALNAQRRVAALPDVRLRLAAPAGVPARRVTVLCGLLSMLTDAWVLIPDEPLSSLEEAVSVGESAMALVAPGDHVEPFVLNEFARAQRLLGGAEADPGRLRTAVALADRALALGDHAVRAALVAAEIERAHALDHLAALETDPAAAAELRSAAAAGFARARDSEGGRADVRMLAALRQLNATDVTAPDALEHLAKTVDLLRRTVTSGPLWNDREHALRSFSRLTERIIATGLAADDPERLVTVLERSRGLLSEDAMDIRRDLHDLDPARAKELRLIDARLRALDAQDRAAAAEDFTQRRALDRELAAERARLTEHWSRLRGEEPADDAPDLTALAADGPLVLVASVRSGGYAFLLTGNPARPVEVLELPGLDRRSADERVLTFLTARHFATSDAYPLRVRQSAQAEVRDTLAWLWTAAAGPVLEALGLTGTPTPQSGPWPRLWWCPVGFLSYLPWHAAGPPTGEGVLDRAVSSYTASLRALAYVRSMPGAPAHPRTLIVAQPEAPGASPLRGVMEEVALLQALLPGATLIAGAEATKEVVLAALADHDAVHLACHAMTDVHAPGTSRLLLADHESAPLTVAELSALYLPGRQLAMLSACSTSEISPDLTNEALHLTGAFQLAGFRHVTGALWPVSDATAGEVSRAFYAHLTASGTRPPRTDEAAFALHAAVRELRAAYPATPTIWASYIHTGA